MSIYLKGREYVLLLFLYTIIYLFLLDFDLSCVVTCNLWVTVMLDQIATAANVVSSEKEKMIFLQKDDEDDYNHTTRTRTTTTVVVVGVEENGEGQRRE